MKLFDGKIVLLTAGPTYEPIDPVRFIGNHSTGKMGFALAECFAENGARVKLVTGPTQLTTTHPAIEVFPVMTGEEMYRQALLLAAEAAIWVFAAAVADYRPKTVAENKLKKNEDALTLELVKNVDIAAELGKLKKAGQFSVGFALETENEASNARSKLLRKNLDMIVLNSLKDPGAGFRHDTNKITIIEAGTATSFELKSKAEVAGDIVRAIAKRMHHD